MPPVVSLTVKDLRTLTSTWTSMLSRCQCPWDRCFPNYGGRGIVVCDRWRTSFDAFAEDMGARPSRAYSLDRIDVNGHYAPENCRWADRVTQARNKRNTKIPADELPLLLEMVEAGTPIHDVAQAFGVTKGAIRNILCRRGIKANQRRRDGGANPRRPKITPDMARAMRERYARGESVKALAEAFGLKLRAAYYAIRGVTWKLNTS